MATSTQQSIVLWPNPLPLECGVIRAYDKSLRGSVAAGSAGGRLSVQVRQFFFLNFSFGARDGTT